MVAVVAASFGRGYVGGHRLLAEALLSAPAQTESAPVEVDSVGADLVGTDLEPADLSPARHLVAVPGGDAAGSDPVAARLAALEPVVELDDTAPHPIVRLFPLPVEEPAVAVPGESDPDTTVIRFVARG